MMGKNLWFAAAFALTMIGTTPAAAQETPAPAVLLDHVALHVGDMQRSVEFYEGLFGLKEIPSPFPPGGPRWLVFANGLELHLQPGRKGPL